MNALLPVNSFNANEATQPDKRDPAVLFTVLQY